MGTAGQPASAPASFTSTPVSVPAPGGPVTVLAPLTAPVVPPAPSLASFPPAPPGVALAPGAQPLYMGALLCNVAWTCCCWTRKAGSG